MSKLAPTQKSGYIDIKQSSKVRPRKLKSWKHRWAVLTKMSNLSSDEYAAKLDLYDNEAKWRNSSSDKLTFILENVTRIQLVKSKTHRHAFEIVEEHPVLVISGTTELDSYGWILSLQQIFTPDLIEASKDCYQVTVSDNEDSRKWHLSGSYNLTVSSICINLASADGLCVVSWGLNTLIRFNVEHSWVPGQKSTLVIECGPHSATGHSFFKFLSDEADDILAAIRQSICLALTLKQNARMALPTRHRSTSVTTSEKSFQRLYDSQSSIHSFPHSAPQSIPMGRSDSSSSNSTCHCDSPSRSVKLSNSPGFFVTASHIDAHFSPFFEIGENNETDNGHLMLEDLPATVHMHNEKVNVGYRRRSSSHPDKPHTLNNGYAEIQDVAGELKTVSRRNTISCEPPDVDFDRLRSISTVVALLESNNDKIGITSSFQNKDDDLDSAISSMALSVTNEDLARKDGLPSPDDDCPDWPCSCILARRRSSSTPDLQAFWKLNKFENVYEELDELRASVKRPNMKPESDVPPALPARPSSVQFTYNTSLNITKMNFAKNKSLFKKHWTRSFDDNTNKTDWPCNCGNEGIVRSRVDVSNGVHPACQHQTYTNRNTTSVSGTPTNSTRAESVFSAINDINNMILQVQNVKRRRSSDITPVAFSPLSPLNSNIKYATIAGQQTLREEETGMFHAMSAAPVNLINLQDLADDLQLLTRPSESQSKPVQNIPDSLIHFYLDDENVNQQSTSASETSVQRCHSLELSTERSYTSPPFQVSSVSSFIPSNKTWTWLSHSTGSDAHGGVNVHCNHLTSGDIWGIDTTRDNCHVQPKNESPHGFTLSPFF